VSMDILKGVPADVLSKCARSGLLDHYDLFRSIIPLGFIREMRVFPSCTMSRTEHREGGLRLGIAKGSPPSKIQGP